MVTGLDAAVGVGVGVELGVGLGLVPPRLDRLAFLDRLDRFLPPTTICPLFALSKLICAAAMSF